MPVDPNEFKAALSRWGSGVCVITASDGEGRLGGLTARSFTSVSLTPPLGLLCLGQDSTSYGVFERAGSFVVHILATGQERLSDLFASKSDDKFERVDYRAGAGGAPILSGCLAVLECAARQKITVGDHLILVGEVQSALSETSGEADPLWYYGGGYRRLAD